MPWKYEIYSKKITNMLRKVYWKKDFSGKRILITPFNYSFQYFFQIIYKRPLALFWVGVCWSTFLCFWNLLTITLGRIFGWTFILMNTVGQNWIGISFVVLLRIIAFSEKNFENTSLVTFIFHQIPHSNDVNLQIE